MRIPSVMDANSARPQSQPNILLLGAALPPVLSTKEILGSRRQSRALLSASLRNTWERALAGASAAAKNFSSSGRRGSGLNAPAGILGFWGNLASTVVTIAGTDTIPAKIMAPFDRNFLIFRYLA